MQDIVSGGFFPSFTQREYPISGLIFRDALPSRKLLIFFVFWENICIFQIEKRNKNREYVALLFVSGL